MSDNIHHLDLESKSSELNIKICSSSSTQHYETLNTTNVEIIPGSEIEYYNRNNEKVRLSNFNDKLV